MKTVVAIGEILVEILATRRGQTFLAPGPLEGPFPSGAPAIFIDQVARLGQPCGLIGCVGNDDFGALNVARLRHDGVDVSAITVHPTAPTGSAFVTYGDDGTRHFVFNISHSASGFLTIGREARSLLKRAAHLHVMGSSLFAPRLVAAVRRAVASVKQHGGTVSFDPNIRGEILRDSDIAASFDALIDSCDIVLPSGPEILAMTGALDETSAVGLMLARGVGTIVIKRGHEGASAYTAESSFHVPPLTVAEIDPTGAGDCFGAAFIVCWLRGMGIAESLRNANAAGARQVTVRGPMEGVSTFADLQEFLAREGSDG